MRIDRSMPFVSRSVTVRSRSPSAATVLGWRVPCAARNDSACALVKSASEDGTLQVIEPAVVQSNAPARDESVVRLRTAPFQASVVAHVNVMLLSLASASIRFESPMALTAPPLVETVVVVLDWKSSIGEATPAAGLNSRTTVTVGDWPIARSDSFWRQRNSSMARSLNIDRRTMARIEALATDWASVLPMAVPAGPLKSLMPQQLKSLWSAPCT